MPRPHNQTSTAASASSRGARDVYRDITDHIVEAIEAGAGTFQMPWHRGATTVARPANAKTGRQYSGVNVLALWVSAEHRGYTSGLWATYKQWQDLEAQVRKGEKASPVVFYKELSREVLNEESGETEMRSCLFARCSWVFNADQVKGFEPPKPAARNLVEVVEQADGLVVSTTAEIRHGGDRAYYRLSGDYIQMPDRERFTGTATSTPTESYYATLLHELTHWTAHETRLDRKLSGRFGDQAYAMEELVAELGAAFLCADLHITNSPRADHAAYVAHWLAVLKKDKKAVFNAASKAAKAADYLAGTSPDGGASGPEER